MLLPFLEYFLRPVPGYAQLVQPVVERVALRSWRKHKRPPAPRTIKVAAIRRLTGGRPVFVETGTFYGDTLAAVENDFDRLYSIELHPRLAQRAERRFRHNPRVTIVQGDSASRLGPVLHQVSGPAVLLFDGHYSGKLTARGDVDTPILGELDVAFRDGTPDDVILIDDARLFGKNPAYPSLAELEQRVSAARPNAAVRVEDDMVQIIPS